MKITIIKTCSWDKETLYLFGVNNGVSNSFEYFPPDECISNE